MSALGIVLVFLLGVLVGVLIVACLIVLIGDPRGGPPGSTYRKGGK